MPFQPGQSGNPGGRAKAKPFRDALMLEALNHIDEPPKAPKTKLQAAAQQLIGKALAGDVPALKELADRVDGKVPQGVIGGDEGDEPLKVVTRILLGPLESDERPKG